jgi:20S proteasome alpha/beta subunit
MTTIAYRDGVIAGDSMITEQGMVVGTMTKVGKKGPILFGCAGDAAFAKAFLDWIHSGMKGDCPTTTREDTQGIIAFDGHILSFMSHGVDRMKADYYAVGSGQRAALGAMAAGAGAEQAVRAVCQFDCYSGGEITVLTH